MIKSFLRLAFAILSCTPLVTLADSPLQIGSKLPSVKVVDQDSKTFDLAAEGAKGFLLVYFYPKADTPGCTAQACSLRDAYQTLTTKGVKVVGVSSDQATSQKAFKDKYKLPFRLVADPDHQAEKAFGVPLVFGFATRQAYLFKDGVLVWKDEHASTEKQANDVLDFLAKTDSNPAPSKAGS